MPNEVWERVEEILLAEKNLVMNRVQMLGDDTGIRQFAVGIFGVAHGKSFDRGAADLGHQRRHRTGVDATAEEDSERNIAHQVTANGLLQQVAIGVDVIAF